MTVVKIRPPAETRSLRERYRPPFKRLRNIPLRIGEVIIVTRYVHNDTGTVGRSERLRFGVADVAVVSLDIDQHPDSGMGGSLPPDMRRVLVTSGIIDNQAGSVPGTGDSRLERFINVITLQIENRTDPMISAGDSRTSTLIAIFFIPGKVDHDTDRIYQ